MRASDLRQGTLVICRHGTYSIMSIEYRHPQGSLPICWLMSDGSWSKSSRALGQITRDIRKGKAFVGSNQIHPAGQGGEGA